MITIEHSLNGDAYGDDVLTGLQRFAVLLRLQAQGLPSVANPLGGTTVHWTVIFFRLARPRTTPLPNPPPVGEG